MHYKKDILLHYMSMAPLALAFERYLECRIYQDKTFERPVLDLGCGDGVFSYILFNEKIDTGIDPNKNDLQRAAVLNSYHELIECSGDRIPKPDETYRTIFSNSVLEHIPDLDPVLREANRLLLTGGHIYITVPSVNFEYYTIGNIILMKLGLKSLARKYRDFCSGVLWKQYHYLSVEQWEALFHIHGFEMANSFAYDDRSTCILNNLLYPIGIIGLLNKRIFKQWILFPTIRKILLFPIYLLIQSKMNRDYNSENGGLLFIDMVKVRSL